MLNIKILENLWKKLCNLFSKFHKLFFYMPKCIQKVK
jgi:hypothetical protein